MYTAWICSDSGRKCHRNILSGPGGGSATSPYKWAFLWTLSTHTPSLKREFPSWAKLHIVCFNAALTRSSQMITKRKTELTLRQESVPLAHWQIKPSGRVRMTHSATGSQHVQGQGATRKQSSQIPVIKKPLVNLPTTQSQADISKHRTQAEYCPNTRFPKSSYQKCLSPTFKVTTSWLGVKLVTSK